MDKILEEGKDNEQRFLLTDVASSCPDTGNHFLALRQSAFQRSHPSTEHLIYFF